MIDPKLVELLACPACAGDVKEHNGSIVCLKCGRKYPIKDNIPVLLVEEAQ